MQKTQLQAQVLLSLQSLLASEGAPVKRLVVGFSAGLDSTVLLHLLKQNAAIQNLPVLAIHIHHGLSPHADQWGSHAASFCQQLDVPCHIVRVQVGAEASIEAAARKVRYQAYTQFLQEGDVLVLAQHRDDQAETVLLRLLRGSGVKGLSAMQERSDFVTATGQHYPLWRPLLSVSKNVLHHYALEHHLSWVEDESNNSDSYDRNFLRLRLLPLLKKRWPASDMVLAATAKRMQEADSLLQEFSERLANDLIDQKCCLNVGGVVALTTQRNGLAKQRLVLRYWLQITTAFPPDEKVLESLRTGLLYAHDDKMPVVVLGEYEVRRYQGWLYILPKLKPIASDWSVQWQGDKPLLLPDGRYLDLQNSSQHQQSVFTVCYRQGGEKIHRHGQHQSVKKLLQDKTIPPWERDRLPLVWQGNTLLAVGGTEIKCDTTTLHFVLQPYDVMA